MLVMVISMLIVMRTGHRLTRGEGVFLFVLYLGYLGMMVKLFL